MGRALIPSDFAILQTLNSVALVYTTASGVFQPVVSRFIAEARGTGQAALIPAIFQSFLRAAFWFGCILAALVFLFSKGIAELISLPIWTIQISAGLVFLSTLRPIAAGVLQGMENFIAFGFARLALAVGRLILVFFLMQANLRLRGAVIALLFGWLLSVGCAFLFVNRSLWAGKMSAPQNLLSEGWKLSFYALLGYLAYMSLTSLDLVWVNQNLNGDLAGAYASLVLLRRIIALLPGVAVTVMFPRVAKLLAEGHLPNRILVQTASIILVASTAISVLYFLFSAPLIRLVFGKDYQSIAPLLGWMGIAMMGVSLSSIWLNYYLAERPRNFIIILGMAVALEWTLLNRFPPSLQSAVLAFGITGWMLALSGLILYLFKIRQGHPNSLRLGA